ncbi:unnamed protein product [Paramecium octaurelia]|uniref:WD40-repeat-containing domain n=1 Tax=Paramecium octaurelia TaxID=43137 RepID=A0A8S1X777_PAROT|nr:unnamed protein product [Paramecium octaurelia]
MMSDQFLNNMIESKNVQTQMLSRYEENSLINIDLQARSYAMAINSQNNLLTVGSGYDIKIFDLTKNQTQNTVQEIKGKKENVFCLLFLSKNSSCNSFISASNKIIIWQEQGGQWHNQKSLKAEKPTQIKSLVVHPQGDLIICGSQRNIQFWFKNLDTHQDALQNNQQEWVCKQLKYDDTQGLSINQNGDTLVQCSFSNKINVFKGSNRQEWIKIKTIDTKDYGLRLCFITNDLIAFQERGSRPHDNLYFYSLNEQNYSMVKVRGGDTSCNSLFPLIYVPSKKLLIDKNGYFVNIIRIEEGPSQKYELMQYYDFREEYIYGTVSDDGNLLITWNEKQNQVQVRRYLAQN